MEQNNEIILFETSDKEVTLSVQLKNDSVWLNREQLQNYLEEM